MTEQVQREEEPNPYNKKKSWHVGEDKPFVSSNNLFFEEPSNVEAESEVAAEGLETTKDTPYKSPNYKKRYDDLKKHYDHKLNEFKTREQQLLEDAAKNRPEYVAPKSKEELEKFKSEYPDVYEVVELSLIHI